jgi:hypothetical protein
MNMRIFGAIALATLLAATSMLNVPAEAAAKKKQAVTRTPVAAQINRAPGARVTVPARSFLDGGTEVLPGDRKFMDYALPPTYSPIGVLENTSAYRRSPLPGPFDLPSRNNPWPWNWCVGC